MVSFLFPWDPHFESPPWKGALGSQPPRICEKKSCTNISIVPATIFATLIYEGVLRDSFAIIAKGHNTHEDGEEGLTRHLTKTGTLEQGIAGNMVLKNEMNGTGGENGYGNGRKEASPV